MRYGTRFSLALLCSAALFAGAAQAADTAQAADNAAPGLQNRSIAYVMFKEDKSIYSTHDGKQECPNGLNEGPREEYKIIYPEIPGKKYKLVDTQLARESEIWFPGTTSTNPVPFKYAVGPIAYGLNLDGKIGPNDLTSPDGEKGIDNQLQRAWGCVGMYRSGAFNVVRYDDWRKYQYNNVVIELTDVDSLANDDDVTLTTYRGLDKLLTNATGSTYLDGGTQRLDMRWGKDFIQKFHGKIVDGVLMTEGAEYLMPSAGNSTSITDIRYYNTHWRLKVSPTRAEGLFAGYMDIEDWNQGTGQIRSTHHQAYDRASTASIYRALRKLADYMPDPVTGQNMAISMATKVAFTQVFAIHPPAAVGANVSPATEAKTEARHE